MFEIEAALRALVERGGSDLHVKVGVPPTIRLHGDLVPLTALLRRSSPRKPRRVSLTIGEDRSLTEFEEAGEADFSHSVPASVAFRVNVFRQRGSVSLACRAIPFEVRGAEELGLPRTILRLAEVSRGIVLLTGTTGSGKSTTLAAMIDHINRDPDAAHHHPRGSDRVPARRQALDRQPARNRLRHGELRRVPCAASCARTPT